MAKHQIRATVSLSHIVDIEKREQDVISLEDVIEKLNFELTKRGWSLTLDEVVAFPLSDGTNGEGKK